MNSEWLNVAQAAQKLGLHPNTIKRIAPEELPYFVARSRGDRRYKIEDIEGYIDGRMVYTTQGAK